ncbi:glycosyltransferase family 4 protein [Baekduia soli]|uniref:Glycosyltransferase family 4 protein n=1 Tax=Baekduia soli TaxID=496014 RepID=A0A5B8TZV5_9ACTN|nr:glycosyltransferase family 1 protein [Baekduia soli]QEC46252.1 glycosyltransferase family 4 protein [Baekduia soli]
MPTVAIDARAAAEVPAGRGRYVRELLRALAVLPEAADVRFVLWARERWEDPALAGDRFTWRLLGLPDPAWNVASGLLAGRSADVFLSTNSYLTAWFTRCPTAVTVHDLVAFERPQWALGSAGRIERATAGLAVRRARALPCDSAATRADLVRRFPRVAGRAVAVPLAADAAFARPVARPGHPDLEAPYLLAVGTLEPRKNLERLIAAWVALDPAVRGGHLLALVGPRGWDDAPILGAAREAGARLLGRVGEDELRALYAGCAGFAYPSLYEGFGLPVLEAMAAGAPVITSTASSLPEVAGDAALLVDPGDTDAIGAAITRLLTEPGLADDLRARGRARAAQFSWERTARETLALLLAACSATGQRAASTRS